MTTPTLPATLNKAQPVSSARFDWAVTVLSAWMIGGIHLDAWAHHQFEVETFFTPWHGVLYSGFLALAALLAGTFARHLAAGQAWRQAMPAGYELSLAGVGLFFLGGVGDMLWHSLFGIEVNVEALLSPTHLLLAVGGGFMVTGPVRAAWARAEARPGWAALTALALLLSVLLFFTAYANPLSEAALARGQAPAGDEQIFLRQSLGVASLLLQTALTMGAALLAVRRWILPFGSLTLLIGLSTLLAISVHEDWGLLPFAVIGGLAADGLVQWLKPSSERPGALRGFAFAVPVIFYALYFATLALTDGLWWTIPLWAGAIVMAGIVGWLLSYAFVPPSTPVASHA